MSLHKPSISLPTNHLRRFVNPKVLRDDLSFFRRVETLEVKVQEWIGEYITHYPSAKFSFPKDCLFRVDLRPEVAEFPDSIQSETPLNLPTLSQLNATCR